MTIIYTDIYWLSVFFISRKIKYLSFCRYGHKQTKSLGIQIINNTNGYNYAMVRNDTF